MEQDDLRPVRRGEGPRDDLERRDGHLLLVGPNGFTAERRLDQIEPVTDHLGVPARTIPPLGRDDRAARAEWRAR